jgi:hypothetical protein
MKRILVALDGSPRADGVLAAAIAAARTDGGRLLLMRAVGLVGDVPKDLWHTTDEPLLAVMDRRACEWSIIRRVRCSSSRRLRRAVGRDLSERFQ